MKKIIIIIVIVLAVIVAISFLVQKPQQQVACTAEALLCPDGSGVGRIAPDCKFAVCPNCTCPSGYIQEGATCNPACYYSTPKCLMASVECNKK